MIKTYHEAPKCIFNEVQSLTDGDYALVNLFEEDAEYYQMFKNAVEAGREVILDNGVFELGTAWDANEFADWVYRLQPTCYIVPDVLENCDATVESFFDFTIKHRGLPGEVMGVVQGKDYEDFVRCYKAIEPYCDRVGISFDCSWYKVGMKSSNRWEQLAGGRIRTLLRMEEDHVINPKKKHHLLGVALPQEMFAYGTFQKQNTMRWITSVDTSNPVVHGLKGITYTTQGLQDKETQKLYTLINSEVDDTQRECIMHNIMQFKAFCAGTVWYG